MKALFLNDSRCEMPYNINRFPPRRANDRGNGHQPFVEVSIMGIVSSSPKIGDVFNAWSVISEPVRDDRPEEGRHWFVTCRCQCGAIRRISVNNLIRNHTKSCGCLKASLVSKAQKEIADDCKREYAIWKGIKSRCNNPNRKSYADYGAKGIKMSAEWSHSFSAFYADMGPRPDGGTVDRIDNAKGYQRGNCRWVERSEQNRNKTTTVLLTFNGETKCVADWARHLGTTPSAISSRLKSGWTVEKTLSTEFKKRGAK